jgi:hypothetical protein
MKNKYSASLIQSPLLAIALATGAATAGVTETMTTVPAPSAVEDVVSGVLALDFNSHFISYGADVWGDGSSLSDPTFNPMIELAIALPADLTFTIGAWFDINNRTPSAIGGKIQEIDIWTGLSYTFDKFTVGATYQQWNYASETEEILDISLAYDTFLSPSLTFHNRLDAGGSGGDVGTVIVLGLSHDIELGAVTISFPFNLAYFLEDEYHALGVSDDGFGFASLGVAASVPLTALIGDAYGDWSLNAGLTYYVTSTSVIPNNDEGDFLTANLGIALAF